MPIDTHVRVTAWLHIVLGVLAAGALVFVGLFFGLFGALLGAKASGDGAVLLAWFGGLGLLLFLAVLALPVLEIVGGVLLLGGSTAGRAITLVFSVLGLINVPVGTAIGLYSLWALLRAVSPAPMVVTMEPGLRSY